MFRDKVLRIWSIVYDFDADRTYTFTEWGKVLAAIEGSIRVYLGDHIQNLDHAVGRVLLDLRHGDNTPYIPIKVNNLTITIYRWELDANNQLHKLLTKCYDQADPTLRQAINYAFTEPR